MLKIELVTACGTRLFFGIYFAEQWLHMLCDHFGHLLRLVQVSVDVCFINLQNIPCCKL